MEEVEAKLASMDYTIHSQAAQIASYKIQIDHLNSEVEETEAKTFCHDVRSGEELRRKDETILKLQAEVAGLRQEKEDDDERVRDVRARWLGREGDLGLATGTKRQRDSTPEQYWDGGWGVPTQKDDSSGMPAAKKRVSPSTASSETLMNDFPMDYAEPSDNGWECHQGIKAAKGDWFQDDYDDKGVEW
ncbi:MAG: hypothetical protein Q9208_006391 [Pyrenodesmia sp. 3 TL-2023]